MASEFVGRRQVCRFYIAFCVNKMAVTVTAVFVILSWAARLLRVPSTLLNKSRKF